jgi:N-acetylglutamate synthase-like GNAT family acetyltransferase
MESRPVIRKYNRSDKETVLSLLRLNTPEYFAPQEENDLKHYLEKELEEYFVLEINDEIVGCGGFNFSEYRKAGIISWDFFHPDFQGRSLGSTLLKYRIEKLLTFKEVERIIVRTSQFAWKFYEKNGFRLIEKKEDHWAKGYHMYLMEYSKK